MKGLDTLDESTIFIFKVAWLTGISISFIGLLTELGILLLIPRCRKFDEKVLTNMTATRIVNTICEYYFLNHPSGPLFSEVDQMLIDACLVIGFSTDFVLVLWMFVFTKNLYDKVVAVFVFDKWNFAVITSIIWAISIPMGLLFLPIVKKYQSYLLVYHSTYYCVKLMIVIINTILFVRIFTVAKRKGKNTANRNLKDVVRTTVGAFILFLTNVLQVLTTDLCTILYGNIKILTMSSSVWNSYHVIPVMIIFVLLVRAKLRGFVLRHGSTKLMRLQLVPINSSIS